MPIQRQRLNFFWFSLKKVIKVAIDFRESNIMYSLIVRQTGKYPFEVRTYCRD